MKKNVLDALWAKLKETMAFKDGDTLTNVRIDGADIINAMAKDLPFIIDETSKLIVNSDLFIRDASFLKIGDEDTLITYIRKMQQLPQISTSDLQNGYANFNIGVYGTGTQNIVAKLASSDIDGLMSKSDKIKLDSLVPNENVASKKRIGTFSISGTNSAVQNRDIYSDINIFDVLRYAVSFVSSAYMANFKLSCSGMKDGEERTIIISNQSNSQGEVNITCYDPINYYFSIGYTDSSNGRGCSFSLPPYSFVELHITRIKDEAYISVNNF